MKVNQPKQSAAAVVGHRERKKQKMREQLTEAALSLFEERGYEETTIDEIAARADVVPRTFFRYFRSKDDALFEWYDRLRERTLAALAVRPADESALRALHAVAGEVLDAHHARERILLIVEQLGAASPEIHARQAAARYDVQIAAARLLASRLAPSEELAARLISALFFASMYVAVDRWTAEAASRRLHDYYDAVFAEALEIFKDIDGRYVLR